MTKSKGTKYNYMEPSVRYDVFFKKSKMFSCTGSNRGGL